MEYVAGLLFVFALLRLITALVNRAGGTQLPASRAAEQEKISVLIPARNEAHRLGALLEDIRQQDYSHYEVWVYDDSSQDNTAAIAGAYASRDNRFHCVQGGEVPGGWLGKNYACHQMAAKATGDYLLFLDADVRIGRALLSRSLHYVKRHALHLLSVFPKQEMYSFGEKLTVPLMNWILTSLLPLPLIRRSAHPALAAANGQFMLFEGTAYRKNEWHRQVSSQRVEDIAIMKRIKKSGYTGQTLLGDDAMRCRMYRGFRESVEGFSRNVQEYFGGSYFLTLLFAVITTFGFVAVAYAWGMAYMAAYLLIVLAVKGVTASASRQPVILNMLLLPLQLATFWIIVASSLKKSLKKTHHWKGRNVS